MFDKLVLLFPHAILQYKEPNLSQVQKYFWFHAQDSNEWLGIPNSDVSQKELNILKALFPCYEPSSYGNFAAQRWYNFLFFNKRPPEYDHRLPLRFLYFQIDGSDWEPVDIESALMGFFNQDTIVLWESAHRGILIEKIHGQMNITEEELGSLKQTFASDFFLNVSFYIGKIMKFSATLPAIVKQELSFFANGLRLLPKEKILTFEKVFPQLLVSNLSDEWKRTLKTQLLDTIAEEPELLSTIMIYLENNSNVSVTAKKLYLHRNTLQYRLDKFTEKTGVPFRDFNSTITTYLACLLYEQAEHGKNLS
ncbi:helix-turn-helix domain-containing protein [Bacillaceae bacterium Marseille-Q3522]|nr:helix-turn-helix domain-containing protein [Bacillaceae bacterium Marseille-Q3522]